VKKIFVKTAGMILLLMFSLNNINAQAESIFNVEAVKVGIAMKSLDLDVYDLGSVDPEGTLTEGQYITLDLALVTPYNFIKESKFGYYFEYGFSNFDMGFQVTGGGAFEEDLDTSASGIYFHLTPFLFYNFGDSVTKKNNHSFLVGIGLGLGYIQAEGDIEFTETTSNYHLFSIDGFTESFGLMMEYQYQNWYIRISNTGPSLESGGYEYDVSSFATTFGYSFEI